MSVKLLEAWLPALLCFGPVFMVMGAATAGRPRDSRACGLCFGYLGAIMIATGAARLLVKVNRLEARVEELGRGSGDRGPSGK